MHKNKHRKDDGQALTDVGSTVPQMKAMGRGEASVRPTGLAVAREAASLVGGKLGSGKAAANRGEEPSPMPTDLTSDPNYASPAGKIPTFLACHALCAKLCGLSFCRVRARFRP